MWFWLALGSAIFAALTSILAKVGIKGVESNLATAIRTMVVVVMAWGMVFITNQQAGIKDGFSLSCLVWLLVLHGFAITRLYKWEKLQKSFRLINCP